MSRRRTLGLNIVRHEQMRAQRGGILPMGAPIPAAQILPMARDGRSPPARLPARFLARILGR